MLHSEFVYLCASWYSFLHLKALLKRLMKAKTESFIIQKIICFAKNWDVRGAYIIWTSYEDRSEYERNIKANHVITTTVGAKF